MNEPLHVEIIGKNRINLSLPWCHLQSKGHRFVSQCRITPQRNGEIPGATRAAVSPTGQWHELQAMSGRTWREVKSTWIVPRTKLLNLLNLCPKWKWILWEFKVALLRVLLTPCSLIKSQDCPSAVAWWSQISSLTAYKKNPQGYTISPFLSKAPSVCGSISHFIQD